MADELNEMNELETAEATKEDDVEAHTLDEVDAPAELETAE